LALLREAVTRADGLGYPGGVADALAGFAAAAVETGEFESAARFLGAAATVQEQMALRLVAHHAQHQRAIEATRGRLGEAAFATTLAAGRALPLADAIAEALAFDPPALTPVATTTDPLPPAAVRAGLTRREVEVLRLLVERRTDGEMAAILSISPQTVATHVARIREKLGVSSRRAAASLAQRDGLI
jgi:non-specific serine/threonine protein kinase